MKKVLLNTRLAPAALWLRERMELFHAAGVRPEIAGMVANDAIARRLLIHLCADGKVFVDVGAHIGSVITAVLHSSKPSKVIAVEAIPAKADRLRAAFPDVEIHCCALGETEGEVSFYIADKQSGFSSIDQDMASRQGDVRKIRVPMRQLDRLIDPTGIDLIKIDVEGAELGVLRGAEQTLRTSRPTIMFESGIEETAAFPRRDLWGWLNAHEYRVVVPNRLAHEDIGLDEAGFVEAHLYPPRSTNFFAVARERVEEIRGRARRVLGIG